MYKLEHNYVLGGRVSVNYIQFASYPYMSAFYDYPSSPNLVNGALPMYQVLRTYFSSIGIHTETFSFKINRIVIKHFQPNEESYQLIDGQTHEMDYFPPTVIQFSLGTKYNFNYIPPMIDQYNYGNFKEFDIKPFTYNSPPGEYLWEFDEKTNVPGYGMFTQYTPYPGVFKLDGHIYARGFYSQGNNLEWLYRIGLLLIDVTVRDQFDS